MIFQRFSLEHHFPNWYPLASPTPKVASDSHKKKIVLPQTVYQILLNVIYQPTTRIGFNNSGLKSSLQENLPHFFFGSQVKPQVPRIDSVRPS